MSSYADSLREAAAVVGETERHGIGLEMWLPLHPRKKKAIPDARASHPAHHSSSSPMSPSLSRTRAARSRVHGTGPSPIGDASIPVDRSLSRLRLHTLSRESSDCCRLLRRGVVLGQADMPGRGSLIPLAAPAAVAPRDAVDRRRTVGFRSPPPAISRTVYLSPHALTINLGPSDFLLN